MICESNLIVHLSFYSASDITTKGYVMKLYKLFHNTIKTNLAEFDRSCVAFVASQQIKKFYSIHLHTSQTL